MSTAPTSGRSRSRSLFQGDGKKLIEEGLRLHRQSPAALQAQAGLALSATSRKSPNWKRSCSPRSGRKIEVFDRPRQAVQADRGRAGSAFTRLLKQYEGWALALRGQPRPTDVRAVPRGVPRCSARQGRKRRGRRQAAEPRPTAAGDSHTTAMVDEDPLEIPSQGPSRRARALRARTRIKRSLFDSPEYRQLIKVHAQLIELAGTPPLRGLAQATPHETALSLRGAARGP